MPITSARACDILELGLGSSSMSPHGLRVDVMSGKLEFLDIAVAGPGCSWSGIVTRRVPPSLTIGYHCDCHSANRSSRRWVISAQLPLQKYPRPSSDESWYMSWLARTMVVREIEGRGSTLFKI